MYFIDQHEESVKPEEISQFKNVVNEPDSSVANNPPGENSKTVPPAFAVTIRDENDETKQISDFADHPNSKQYNYLREMANSCPRDVRHDWEKYLEPLSATSFYWQQIIIADPISNSDFIGNLVEIFNEKFGVSRISVGVNTVHFKIAVATAAVFTEPLTLRRNMLAEDMDIPKIPDPTMLERFDSVVNSYDNGHYHEIFEHGLSAWHIKFVVNCWYDDDDLQYIRNKFSKEDLETPRYYTEYTKTVGTVTTP